MVNLRIDGVAVSVPEGTTVLEAAKTAGINIPTLCYLKDINEIGACRVCVVEICGESRLAASCNTPVFEGMQVLTNSPKVIAARKTNVELILSQHGGNCTTCIRSGNCSLQSLANELGLYENPYTVTAPENRWDKTLPLIRDNSKCIKCMRCVQICDKVQGLGIWDIISTGSRTNIGVSGGKNPKEAGCVFCGQCITHCPVGALRERDDVDKVIEALADKEKVTVIQVAPAVRAAWGEGLGLSREFATEKRLAAALRKIGFDYIFDTDFSADLTIMEEGSELIQKLSDKKNNNFPMFTSCCPGWVRFIKTQYPDMACRLSTAKSPQQMFGAVAKSYFAEKAGIDPSKIHCVSVMPCVAKKYECDLPDMCSSGQQDVDTVLTVREIDRLIRRFNINVSALDEEEFDSPLGTGTGAAVIFGSTGGVMEAALRSAYYLVTGKNPAPDAFEAVRNHDGAWSEAEFDINGITVKTAVASGLGNTRMLIEAIRSGKADYDFVEIMACPGGCSGGGGQPICDGFEKAAERGSRLYELDKNNPVRFSHENPEVAALYNEYLGEPLSEKAHKLLHSMQ